MITEDQTAVIDFLAASSTHAGADVEVIETHASIVFLAGARAWKLKRAVRYDYLDFSSAERRKTLCEAPVRVNRRTAPTSRCRPAVPSALPAPSHRPTACSQPADASWGCAPRRWSCWPPPGIPSTKGFYDECLKGDGVQFSLLTADEIHKWLVSPDEMTAKLKKKPVTKMKKQDFKPGEVDALMAYLSTLK